MEVGVNTYFVWFGDFELDTLIAMGGEWSPDKEICEY